MQTLYKNSLLSLLLFSIVIITACSEHKVAPVPAKFEISDSLLKKVLIDTVQQANGEIEIMFSAKITVNEERKSNLFPMVSGTVNKVSARLGDQVSKGKVLATVSSSEMAGYDKELIEATAELRTSERLVQQAEKLYESGLSSERELQEAKNNHQIKQAEVRRANAVLKLNGGSHRGLYTIKSPLNGIVIDKNVTDFMQIRSDNDQSLFTVADLSNVWAMVNIYESDISQVKTGDKVLLFTLSYPDRTFEGKIDKIYNLIDEDSKVMNARVLIENPGFLLKPGMLGTVKVHVNSGIDLPVINSRSVIFDDNKNFVLVLGNNRKVKIREIEIARKNGDKVYISKGLSSGEHVIASKQVFLFESLK